MTTAPDAYVSWMHQASTRESGVSWWGERPGWARHATYWLVAGGLLALSVFDGGAIEVDGDRSVGGAAVIAWMFGVAIVGGAIAILRETNWLPAWRTLSRLAVTLAALVGVVAGLLQLVDADIEPTTGDLTPRLIVEYLAWNVADAVPALAVPRSFGWDRPATSGDAFVGTALILVRAFVVLIVLVTLKKLWERVMTDERPPTARQLRRSLTRSRSADAA